MGRITNALAKLAERLSTHAEYLDGNNDKASEDVSKAKRIIAELAKVEYGDDGHIRYWTDTEIKLKKCRAIAEEGAGDGFKRD